jgi:hypothetical protein
MKRFDIYLRKVWDTKGKFEVKYGWTPEKILKNVSKRKAIKHIEKHYGDLKSGRYIELCPSNSNKTIGLFGYFNHSGDVNK